MVAHNIPYLIQSRRRYLPKPFMVVDWSDLFPLYEELVNRPLTNVAALERWILDCNEVDAAVNEEFGWRYINLTTNTSDRKSIKAYEEFVQNISPNVTNYAFQLNRKLITSSFLNKLDKKSYFVYVRSLRSAVQLYREKNVTLLSEERLRSKKYSELFAAMMVEVEGVSMTIQQANALLEEPDRKLRKQAYCKSKTRMIQDGDKIESVYDDLVQFRHKIAQNAGYENYRDFKFQQLGRFDYQIEDCFEFHDSVRAEIIPVINEIHEEKKSKLGIEKLRPWDLNVDVSGLQPLRPFEDIDDLIDKSIQCLSRVDSYFGTCISVMRSNSRLDLETRTGKRPGGYNMPLPASGIPFIFMNAANSIGDMRTFMHESGHAVHSFLTREYKLSTAKRPPSEIAELAAMTMELLTMEHWHIFFSDQEDLRRAKIWQLESILQLLPWIMTIDRFQHWVYTHPDHTQAERTAEWNNILMSLSSDIVDYTDFEQYASCLWYRQLHLFEVPFYYIEYGMAQLGAIAIWKRYKEEGQIAIHDYVEALKLGYTRTINEVYETAGISFDFSRPYVRELATFMKAELAALKADL